MATLPIQTIATVVLLVTLIKAKGILVQMSSLMTCASKITGKTTK